MRSVDSFTGAKPQSVARLECSPESKKLERTWRQYLIGVSRAVLDVCEVIELVASKRCTVLISGETGTGKEVVARALHAAGDRSAAPMVAVNCTALPSNLAETELFGHAKGAFTGAHTGRVGRFEQAHRGTIFLDEIGDLPLDVQPKLLRVLQEHELQRIGSSETIRVDVRVIAASNVDLETAVRERRFREDLYYRLNVVPIHLPPLRERREDIPLLLDHFLAKTQAAEGGPGKRITAEAEQFLQTLDWPGNIRQLEHSVQMAVALSGDRNLLIPDDFKTRVSAHALHPDRRARASVTIPQGGIDFDEVVGNFERSLLNQALAASGGNKARAADLLRIKRTTLLAKLKSFEERDNGVCEPASGSRPPPKASLSPAALVVEQDSSVLKLISKTLEAEGYRVLPADSKPAALELLRCWKRHIGLLVLDLTNGENEWPASSLSEVIPDVPTLEISAGNRTASELHPGCKLLLSPFSSEQLRNAVNELKSSAASVIASECCA